MVARLAEGKKFSIPAIYINQGKLKLKNNKHYNFTQRYSTGSSLCPKERGAESARQLI